MMNKLLIAASLVVGGVGGCHNPNYCAGNPDNNCNEPGDATGDGMEALDCTHSGCATGVCDTVTKACGECTTANASVCAATAPICKNDLCTACAGNSDCPGSNTCLPSGACAAEADVAYVQALGTGTTATTCTQAAPCPLMAQALAVGTKPYIHLVGAITESIAIANDTKTIIGERNGTGAITSTIQATAGNLVTVTSNGSTSMSVTLVDLALVGTSNNNDAIQLSATGTTATKVSVLGCTLNGVTGFGIETSHGALTVDRTAITNNLSGGIKIDSTAFQIKNAFVTGNSSATTLGGIYASTATGTIEFTTIASNLGAAGSAKGLTCNSTPATVDSVIVASNSNAQTTGNCVFTYSDFFPDAGTGATNLNLDPGFVVSGFHLASTSMMKDRANTAATLALDYDGNARPQGPARDIGADELMP